MVKFKYNEKLKTDAEKACLHSNMVKFKWLSNFVT